MRDLTGTCSASRVPALKVLQVLILLSISSRVQCTEPLFGDGHQGLTTWLRGFDSDPRYDDTAGEFDLAERNFTLPRTHHKCLGGDKQNVCVFHNLLLWNDTFFYVTPEETVLAAGLPNIPLSWVHIPFAEKLRFAEGSCAHMAHPDSLPFALPGTPVLEMRDAVVWQLTYHDNFGHLLGEHSPSLHAVLCAHLGRCTFSHADRDVHLLLTHNEDNMMAVVPPAAREMFHCFTKYPLRQTDELVFKDRVVLIRRAVVGVGPTCRGFPWCRPNHGRSPPETAHILGWRTRLMQCLGLPAQAKVDPKAPTLAIINRPYSVGRGFLNVDQMVATLQEKFPVLRIRVEVLDGKLLAEQARIYADASIVVQAHGAALGHMIFLPKGASMVDVSPVHHEDKVAWQFFMAADLRPLHINPIRIPPQRGVPMLHHLQKYPEWHQLAPEYREQILREGTCPSNEETDWQFSIHIWCKFYWVLKHANLLVDPQHISDAVEQAVQHLVAIARDASVLDTARDRRFSVP